MGPAPVPASDSIGEPEAYEDKAAITEPYCQAEYDQPQPRMTTDLAEIAGSGPEIMYWPGDKTAKVPLAWSIASIHAVSAEVPSVAPSPVAPNALASTTWTSEGAAGRSANSSVSTTPSRAGQLPEQNGSIGTTDNALLRRHGTPNASSGGAPPPFP
jgi:hypothetical protein